MYKTRKMKMFYGDTHPTGLVTGYGRQLSLSDLKSWEPLMTDHFRDPFAYWYIASPVRQSLPPPGLEPGMETFWSTEFKKPRFNECFHVKNQVIFNLPFQTLGWMSPSNWWYYPCMSWGWSYPLKGVPVNVEQAVEPSDFTRARAWASLRVRYDAEFEMLNALFELKDFRDIAKNFGRLLRPGTKSYQFLKQMGSTGNIKVMQKKELSGQKVYTATQALDAAVNTVAGAWLLNSYAIQPTIKDVVGMTAAASQIVADHQAKFKADGLSLQKRHYSETILSDSTQYYQGSGLGYQDWLQGWRDESHVYTATMHYTYNYIMRSVRDAFIKYWGLTGTAEEFWNMIPGSFLLDYFVQVGKALRMTEVDPNVELRVLQYSESVLHKVTTSYGVRNSPALRRLIIDGVDLTNADTDYHPVAGVQGSYYARKATSPYKGLILPKLRMPNTNQWRNCVALLKTIF